MGQSQASKAEDLLTPQRDALKELGDGAPMYDVCYHLSMGRTPMYACLLAQVKSLDFEAWSDRNEETVERSKHLGIALYEHELRNIALGYTSRRAQMPATKITLELLDQPTTAAGKKRKTPSGRDRALPHPAYEPKAIESSLGELEKVAKFTDQDDDANPE